MSLLNIVNDKTIAYLKNVSKVKQKKIGQFFTPIPIAEYMSSLSNMRKEIINILDPGAGSGILSAAILDALLNDDGIKQINLDLYEDNTDITSLLRTNLIEMQKACIQSNIALNYKIIEDNFITANQLAWTGLMPNKKYDIVISNPPYKKIGKKDLESCAMKEIVHGQPNLYFLFMAMGSRLLKDNGEFIYIVPRSFSSGLYFTAFRKYFINTMRITDLHLFTSRESISGINDNILQETIILRAIKSQEHISTIKITESVGEDCFDVINRYYALYDVCVRRDDNSFLFFPANEEDLKILEFVNQWPDRLTTPGFRMKTGIVVDFRETRWMCTENNGNAIPLLWAYNFENHRIQFPMNISGKPQYLFDMPETKRLQMDKGNYILLKRFTSKEENKRLQCALLFENDFPMYDSISTENHLNYITKINGKMTEDEMYGLFVILNSSHLDRFFRILNGSTQVNANEINAIPFPSYSDILKIGRKAISSVGLSSLDCDAILDEQFADIPIRKAI